MGSTERSETLGALWPAVTRRVTRALRARGLRAEQIAELLQETAVRALRSDSTPLTSIDELAAWTYTVAWRIHLDQQRRPHPPVDPLEESAHVSRHDVPAEVEARLGWQHVLAAIATLTATDRAALAHTLTDEQAANRTEAVRWAVRRHRARTHLLAIIGKLGGIPATAWAVLRRLTTRRRAVVATAMATPILVAALLAPHIGHRPIPPPSAVEAAPARPSSAAPSIATVGPVEGRPSAPPPASNMANTPAPARRPNEQPRLPVAEPSVRAGLPRPATNLLDIRPPPESPVLDAVHCAPACLGPLIGLQIRR